MAYTFYLEMKTGSNRTNINLDDDAFGNKVRVPEITFYNSYSSALEQHRLDDRLKLF